MIVNSNTFVFDGQNQTLRDVVLNSNPNANPLSAARSLNSIAD